MSTGDAIASISAIVAFVAVLVSTVLYFEGVRRERESRFQDLKDQFASYEIFAATRALWDHYRKYDGKRNPQVMVQQYLDIKRMDEQTRRDLKPSDVRDFDLNTLHFQRRGLSFFWRSVGSMMKSGLIRKQAAFALWQTSDVDIVHDVLLPIERGLAGNLVGGDLSEKDALRYLDSVRERFAKPPKQTAQAPETIVKP